MTHDQIQTGIKSYFIQEHSVQIRIWHWLTFLLITAAMVTVLLNSTIMNPRKNVEMVQEQLQSKGLTATGEQAFAVSHEYEDKIWGVHKWIGFGLAFLLVSRILIELTHSGDEKFRSRFKKALGLFKQNDGNRKEYRHYIGTKLTYIVFYLLLLCMAATGLCLAFGRELGIPRDLRETIKEIHAFGQYIMYGFVFIHLLGVIVSENQKARGIVSGMINGNKIILVILLFISTTAYSQSPEVKTENGVVSGYKSGDISVYKGIPFAEPPVGNLRWKAPQPPKNRTGVLKCDKFSASPMQSNPVPFRMWTEEFITPPGNLSEDCLYLNVWTPAKTEKEKLPVLVWIYGGGFSSGSAACAIYDGEELAKKGIIFVSINYRVGVFGFLAHPELSKESKNNVSGNYGLLDQVAALQWVKKNIAAFGGDPQKVTIAGQSAGSMSVSCLVSAPVAAGLFRGAIAHSGGILTNFEFKHLAEAEKDGVSFAESMKVSGISDLRKIPADKLVTAGMRFMPVMDGYILQNDLYASYKAGKFNDVPFIAGWVTGDGSLRGDQSVTPEEYKKQATEKYGKNSGEYLRIFPGNTKEQILSSMKEMVLMQFAALPAHLWAGVTKNNAFIYQFTHVPVDKPDFPNYGAFHTSDVPFALNTLHTWNRPWRNIDKEVEKTMSNYWVNFVKTGNPNGNGLTEWSAYNKTSGNVLEIGDNAKLSPGLFKEEFSFLEKPYLKK
jgi:para-nitrobenzyl esterase